MAPTNIDTMFEIRRYPQQYKKFENYDCVICQREFPSPLRYSKRMFTCCKYCENIRKGLIRREGYYLLCKVCDKPMYVTNCRTHSKIFCSRECKHLGQSFISSIPEELQTGRKKYYGPNWLHQRNRVRERDNYTCQNAECGITEVEYGQELSVHHKKPFVYFKTYNEANHLDNLISLCEPCHRKEHAGENHALKFDTEKIVFVNELNKVGTLQRETAKKVVNLLLNTDMNFTQISEETGLSYSRIKSIYTGSRWKELYEKPPREIRPRQMTLAKDPVTSQEKIERAVELLLKTDMSITEIINITGVSKSNLYRIYNGKTNKHLYEKAPRKVRPRREIYDKQRKKGT